MRTHVHLHTLRQIFHTHWLLPCMSIQVNVLSSNTHTHTMKLIDYFTKNQLGAGYVRAARAAEGSNSKKKKKGGVGGSSGLMGTSRGKINA